MRNTHRPRSEPREDVIYGVRPILEVLKHAPQRIRELYTTNEEAKARKGELLELALKRKIAIKIAPREMLTERAGSQMHQSFLATLHPLAPLELKELLTRLKDRERALILALDSVTDPQNVGAILRAAECFGVDGVILPKHRGAGITATVRKASVGASELVPIIEVSNLANALGKCKDEDLWVVATACGADAQPIDQFEFPARMVLVVGGEGDGVRQLTQKLAEYTVEIKLKGKIESLNVSQATTIALYAYHQ